METLPLTPRTSKAFDFSLLCEYSERGIRERISRLSEEELHEGRSALVSRLHSELFVQMPVIQWAEVQVEERRIGGDCWEFRLLVPMRDPNWVAWAISWPPDDEHTNYDPDPESNELLVTQRCHGSSRDEARSAFEANIGGFHESFEQAAREVERYNAAIPYLLSLWIDARLEGVPLITEVKAVKSTKVSIDEIRKELDQMVADGELVFVEEIDPATGELRKRYCHPDRRPMPN